MMKRYLSGPRRVARAAARDAVHGALSWVACAALIGALAGTGAAPVLADEMVETPKGDKVLVKHVIRPGGVTEDYHEYVSPEGKLVKHGMYKRFYRNGAQQEWITYAHGVEHGPFVFWQAHNIKELEGSYYQGRLDGRVTRYYSSGLPRREYHYERGSLEGPFVTYHDNGTVRSVGTHAHGKKNGGYEEYHTNGALMLKGDYVDSYLEGPILLFTEKGEPLAQGKVHQEQIVGTWTCLAHGDKPERKRPECKGHIFWDCLCD